MFQTVSDYGVLLVTESDDLAILAGKASGGLRRPPLLSSRIGMGEERRASARL